MLFSFFTLLLPILGQMSPDGALQKLIDGNTRYSQDELANPRRDQMRRQAVVSKQEPFATILTCSDSRVPPEIIFDQGVGDLFVVRVAGNVAGPIELDSLEYSALYLHSSLILVLGHENCGAVQAVLSGQTKDIEDVARLIEPALNDIHGENGRRVEAAIKANVRYVVNYLKNTPVLGRLVSEKKLDIVGGYYNLKTGAITFL